MGWIEGIATVFGVFSVWFNVRRNPWCWPAGLVQVSLYLYIFYQVKLYSDFILHMVFVVLQIYGWYHWLHGGEDHGELKVSRQSPRALVFWIAVTAVGTVLWGWGMASWTDAALPYGDAFTTVASLVAMWAMARKELENWYFWIAVDVVAIGIYYVKALYFTTGLYAVFLGMCVVGVIEWGKALESEAEADPGTGAEAVA